MHQSMDESRTGIVKHKAHAEANRALADGHGRHGAAAVALAERLKEGDRGLLGGAVLRAEIGRVAALARFGVGCVRRVLPVPLKSNAATMQCRLENAM